MSDSKESQNGIASSAIVMTILLMVVLSGVGLVVYNKNQKTSDNELLSTTAFKTTSPKAPVTAEKEQPLPEGMKRYKNDKYGISFNYPSKWIIEEVSIEKPGNGPVPVEFGINLNYNTEDKYKAAATLEIINRNYQSVADYYNSAYIDSAITRTTKTKGMDYGKTSTHYASVFNIKPTPSRSERFVMAVGDKTYSFQSINEELNVQRDASYWQSFTKVRSSLQLR